MIPVWPARQWLFHHRATTPGVIPVPKIQHGQYVEKKKWKRLGITGYYSCKITGDHWCRTELNANCWYNPLQLSIYRSISQRIILDRRCRIVWSCCSRGNSLFATWLVDSQGYCIEVYTLFELRWLTFWLRKKRNQTLKSACIVPACLSTPSGYSCQVDSSSSEPLYFAKPNAPLVPAMENLPYMECFVFPQWLDHKTFD